MASPKSAGRRVGPAEADRTGGLLLDVHVDDDLLRGRSFAGLDLDVGKETQRANAFRTLADFARIERIALRHAELPPHHAVESGRVAFDVDALDKDARAAGQLEIDIERQVAVVARHPRLHSNEIKPFADRQTLEPGDLVVDLVGRIDPAGAQADGVLEGGDIDLGQVRGHGDAPEPELLAFLHIEGHEIAVTFAADLGIHAGDAEIDIAARGIEIPQHLAIELEAILDEGVRRDDRAQKPRLLGVEDPAQSAIGKLRVADEGDALDLGHAALEDLEHEVDAVVRPPDDLGLDPRGETSLLRVAFGDEPGVGFGSARVEHPARLRLDESGQLLVVDAAVALEGNRVDRRILNHPDHELVALRHDLDRLEEARADDALVGIVELRRRNRLTARDPCVTQDRAGLDPLVALDLDVVEAVALGVRQLRQRREGHGDGDRKRPCHMPRPDPALVPARAVCRRFIGHCL